MCETQVFDLNLTPLDLETLFFKKLTTRTATIPALSPTQHSVPTYSNPGLRLRFGLHHAFLVAAFLATDEVSEPGAVTTGLFSRRTTFPIKSFVFRLKLENRHRSE